MLFQIISVMTLISKEVSAVQSRVPLDTPIPEKCTGDSITCSENVTDSCPPGLFCKGGFCECGVYPDETMRCDGTSAFILWYACPSFDSKKNMTVFGSCHRLPGKNEFSGKKKFVVAKRQYQALPESVHELDQVCWHLNRTGLLCGRCLPDHYPLAYSFNLTCIPCPHASRNWVRYSLAAYLPLTVFYFAVLFLQINVASNQLFNIVFFCQTISMPILCQALLIEIGSHYSFSDPLFVALKLVLSFHGMWNLDFFRPTYSDLCLGIDILPTLALDYVVAAYPLVLIVLTYILIKLYDQDYRIIVAMWRPFKALFTLFRKHWNVKISIINIFATFFLLSNMKFMSVSFDFLIPTKVYQLYPDHYNSTLGLYTAGNLEYFGREHLPYAILAILVLCVFVVIPVTILALYPFSFFQKLISALPGRWYILHTFMDSFYGCYKDGTQPGTRDCRWFVSITIVIRLSLFLLYFTADKEVYVLSLSVVMITYTILVTSIRPFVSAYLNVTHIVCFQALLLFLTAILGGAISSTKGSPYSLLFYVLGGAVLLFAPLYTVAILLHWIYIRKKFGMECLRRFVNWVLYCCYCRRVLSQVECAQFSND